MSALGRLHIIEIDQPERVVDVRDLTTIGRDSENDIVLAARTVSRCHAMLLRDGGSVLLIDLESTNGTFVNGAAVLPDQPVRLADGDIVRLGQVVARYLAAAQGETKLQAAGEQSRDASARRSERLSVWI